MSQAGARCVIVGCSRVLGHDDDLGVCGDCGLRIARRYIALFRAEENRRTTEAYEARMERSAAEKARNAAEVLSIFGELEQPRGTSYVYYVRIGEHIKIGYTANVKARLSALRVPLDQLLALEPGGRDEEQARHAQFASLRVSRRWENFQPGVELTDHITRLREEYGLPRWLNSPRRGKSGPVTVRMRDG